MENSIETKCLHAGYEPKNGEPRQLPIYQSTTFKYETSEQMARLNAAWATLRQKRRL